MSHPDRFASARAVADAVLFEGYALYPYRASSRKNHLRWQFGVLGPRAWSEAGGGEAWWMETACLVEPTAPAARVDGVLRFLRLRRRTIEVPGEAPGEAGAGSGDAAAGERGFRAVEQLDVDGRLLVPWDEGEVQEIEFTQRLDTGDPGGERRIDFELAADHETEEVRRASGEMAARAVRVRAPIAGALHLIVEPAAADGGLLRLRLRVENLTPWSEPHARREAALGAACIGTHLLLAVSQGSFVSLLDPPARAVGAAAGCRSVRTWPVLAGEPGRRDLLLSAPIILHDHPQVSPESPRDLFDATEIDEILTLRTLLLTDEEKREARATDARVARLIDRVEAAPAAELERLHGALRDPGPPIRADSDSDGASQALGGSLRIGAVLVTRGSRVILRPGPRRADAQDMFLAGRTAVVEAVMRDVEDHDCLAVLVEDDPATELRRMHGRHLYFHPDEVEPLPEGEHR
jgi:hypothetical protein